MNIDYYYDEMIKEMKQRKLLEKALDIACDDVMSLGKNIVKHSRLTKERYKKSILEQAQERLNEAL